MTGHGHVTPNPDGLKARCGGPAICSVCAKELAAKMAIDTPKHIEAFLEERSSLNSAAVNMHNDREALEKALNERPEWAYDWRNKRWVKELR